MKKSISIILFCFLFSISFAQKKEDIVGKWKIVKLITEGIEFDYENIEKSKNEHFINSYNEYFDDKNIASKEDSLEIDSIIEIEFLIYKSIIFNFNSDGTCFATMLDRKENVIYSNENGILTIKYSDGQIEKLFYKIENDLLIISDSDTDNSELTVYLRKVG
jgi:hypothetical protein